MKKGQRFRLNGTTWRVVYVNASRAHCICEVVRTVTVTGKDGHPRQFTARTSKAMDISPTTPLDVLSELVDGRS
jgi:hypothetical protein